MMNEANDFASRTVLNDGGSGNLPQCQLPQRLAGDPAFQNALKRRWKELR
jgi:hypothetical protein